MNLSATICATAAIAHMSEFNNKEQAIFWMELRECWEIWRGGEDQPLSPEAAAYFGNYSQKYFCHYLSIYRPGEPLPRRPSRPDQPWQAWEMVRQYFMVLRPRAGTYLFDDIYSRAEIQAAKKTGIEEGMLRLEDMIGCLLNQFKLRVRDAVRHIVPPRKETSSGDEPWTTPSVTDSIDENDLIDLRNVARGVTEKFFVSISGRAKAGIFLTHHKISLSLAEVGLCLDAKKATLYEEASTIRTDLAKRVGKILQADGLDDFEVETGKLIADEELYLLCRKHFTKSYCPVTTGKCAGLLSLTREKIPHICGAT